MAPRATWPPYRCRIRGVSLSGLGDGDQMSWVTVLAGCLLVVAGIAIRRNTWGLGGFAWKANRAFSPFAGWLDRIGQDRFCRQQGALVVVFGLAFVLIGAHSLL